MTLFVVPTINKAVEDADHDSLWVAVQIFVTGAANMAKALWGQKQAHAEARADLRASLGVQDDSPLRNVTMRNHFEHYDERIDRWDANSRDHNFVDRTIGPPEMIEGVDDLDRFRFFDPSTASVYFWGERFDLRPIADEASRLLQLAEIEASKPHWTVEDLIDRD